MGTRTSYPPGTFSWVDLNTPDQQAAKRFYSELFGWEYEDRDAGPGVVYAMARVGGQDVAAISPPPPGDEGPPRWNSYITVDEVDASARRATELGAIVVSEPFDVFDAGRMAVLRDPVGAFFMVWEPRENIGAGRVNEPGCLSWNELGTTDVDAAARFYGDLFGWRTEAFGPATMFRLPGYVGGEPDQPVPHDVVAVMVAGEPAAWAVDFWIADLEAAVAATEAAGGRVVVGPHDQPPAFRSAVLADPEGATFSLSQLMR
jgi:predicted enzyme related to lactoylglutathione lyase